MSVNPLSPEYKDKFVAFVDILGFSDMVAKSESGSGIPLQEILQLLQSFGSPAERDLYARSGPTICPHAKRLEQHLDFRLTQISDCAIISAEVSDAGLINLLSHCHLIAARLLFKGVLCRGFVTRGSIFHTESQIIGTGYQSAYTRESGVTAFKLEATEKGTPFIEVDVSVVDFVHDSNDKCIKTMYARMVKSDGDVSAVFPFEQLSHSFVIDGDFDPTQQKSANNRVRSIIREIKARVVANVDASNEKAMAKVRHYLTLLDKQLSESDETDTFIDELGRPLGPRRGAGA